MTLIITKLDGTRYNLRELGIRVVNFEPESLNVKNNVEAIDNGYTVTDSYYDVRYIPCDLSIIARDMVDYALFRAELFALFSSLEPFYVVDEHDSAKRWFVRNDGNFNIGRKAIKGDFSLTWLCVNKYAESIGTSLQLVNRDFDSGLWGWGSLINVDEQRAYEFTSNSFTVMNIGTASVDPVESALEITIQAVASSYLQITNNTTGETYRFNGPLQASDTLVLNRARTLKNGVSAFALTNKKLLSLAPGENSFTVTGGTITRIAFNFRFLYL